MDGDRLRNKFVCIYIYTHMLRVWNIYQHLPEQNHPNVGKYTIHIIYTDIIYIY